MPKIYTFILLCLCTVATAQVINIPDPNFKAKLLAAGYGPAPSTDIGFNAAMQPIKIDVNHDGQIQLSEALAVYKLNVLVSGISSLAGIENFTNLTVLDARGNQITAFDATIFPNLKKIDIDGNALTSINVAGMAQLEGLMVSNNLLTSIDLTGLASLKGLGIYDNPISNVEVTHLSNLEFFEGGGQASNITSVDLTGLAHLNTFYWSGEQLQSVNVTGCVGLEVIDVIQTMITEFPVTHCPLLRIFRIGYNHLTAIDVSQNPVLTELSCDHNNLTSLTVNSTDPYFLLSCTNNALTELHASGTFGYIQCYNNLLTTLDLSEATFYKLKAGNNNLSTLFIKNGQDNSGDVVTEGNPLAYICADESEMMYFQAQANLGGYHVNSYCSFEPGGMVYEIHGNAVYDIDSDGCDVQDLDYPHLKYTISDGTQSGAMISNVTGDYSLVLNSGGYTITPVLEYPDYFTVSPETVAVSFPDDGTDLTQNFCITPNGNHNDLEIVVVPVSRPRPGVDTRYKIIFKNNGTEAMSGTVALSFEGDILDFVSSDTVLAASSDSMLSWDYNNLAPFETRSIAVTLNLNTPMEIPAVNLGDLLDFSATVYPVENDETPNDNTFALIQTVVGSFDPNDKTCLEGNFVSPEKIGDYVHYTIRFENTGNYPAENIVVKDRIDTSKFDVSTLIPIAASHSYTSRISEGNNVEFIFQDINLPFAEGNNEGFITFKIKTLPSLENGDTFANTAAIYFDYNFPVVTEPAVTGIQSLGTPDLDFASHFAMYPNPAGNVLNVLPSTGIQIKSLQILNMLGQQVQRMTAGESAVDVSMLSCGIYIVNIATDKGNSAARFIKL